MAYGTSRLFKSTDANAPVLNNSAGSLISVLDAALVNGYGAKSSLGWTKEYSGTNKAVYRMAAGTRYYIAVNDTVVSFLSGSYTMYIAEIRAYEVMVNLENGMYRIPKTIGGATVVNPTITKGFYLPGNFPWFIVGDEAGFYLCIDISVNNPGLMASTYICYYFGDYVPIDVRNKWNFVLIADYYGATAHPSAIYLHTPNSAINCIAARGGSYANYPVYCGLTGISPTYFGTNMSVGQTVSTYDTQKVNGSYVKSPIHLYETVNSNNILLGNLPGLFDPIMLESSYSIVNTGPTLYTEVANSNGNIDVLFRGKHLNNTLSITTSKLILSVGGGFRNVQ